MSEFRSDVSSTYYTTARLVGERCTDDIINKSRASSDTSDSNRFINTRMCVFHQRGACTKGANCTYAHMVGMCVDTKDELKRAPNLLKTRLCQDWLNGSCTTTDCKFAHGRQELRFTHDYYKTKLCHFWQQGGCTKGDLCRHAHGESELRPAPDEMGCIASSTTRTSSNNRMGTASDEEDDAEDLMMVPHPDSPDQTPTAMSVAPDTPATLPDAEVVRPEIDLGDVTPFPTTAPFSTTSPLPNSGGVVDRSGGVDKSAGKQASVCKKRSSGGRAGERKGKLTSGIRDIEGMPPPDEKPPERTPTVTFCVSSSSFAAMLPSKKSRGTSAHPTGHIRTSGNEAGSQSSTTSSMSLSKKSDVAGDRIASGGDNASLRSGPHKKDKREFNLKEDKWATKGHPSLKQSKGQNKGHPSVRAHDDYLHADGGEIVYLNNHMMSKDSNNRTNKPVSHQMTAALRGGPFAAHAGETPQRGAPQRGGPAPRDAGGDSSDRRIAYLEALRLAEVARDLAKKSSELLQQATGGEWDSTAVGSPLYVNASQSTSTSQSTNMSQSQSHNLADVQPFLDGVGYPTSAASGTLDLQSLMQNCSAAALQTSGSSPSRSSPSRSSPSRSSPSRSSPSGSSPSGSSPFASPPAARSPTSRSTGSFGKKPHGGRTPGQSVLPRPPAPRTGSASQAENAATDGYGFVPVLEDAMIPVGSFGGSSFGGTPLDGVDPRPLGARPLGQHRYSAFVPNFKQQQMWEQRNSAPECDLDRLAAKLNEFLINEGETPLYEDTLK
ncbi:putative zinc finger protein [Gregarina niphandrodes]|uniref:Zinc finger protein n=1 Tax=Gregarina niphandrodes TaxID=110365 RepID=A0A023B1Q3_GRENI|nr:putative zinc finger protein [Gregarina niphandrodes]EZG48582.1 putative zinc finger protein [Gregarina niphandrodes]|eukprot:XP_011132086.1 putative zinc finger protein [Gregarina niphandrodes]